MLGILEEFFVNRYFIIFCFVASIMLFIIQDKIKNFKSKYLLLVLIICLILEVEDVLEKFTSNYPDMLFFRLTLSIIGYILRPMAPLCLLLATENDKKKEIYYWIPEFVDIAIFLTAYFSPIAFYFDGSYSFHRGPLGYYVFILGAIYLVLIFVNTIRYFKSARRNEAVILLTLSIGSAIASILDASQGGCRLNIIMLVSSIFYFLYLNSQYYIRDTLTELLNRNAYYSDTNKDIEYEGIIMLDLNNLKVINDTLGHSEGDKAIATIGSILRTYKKKGINIYRIGGDEFVVLFKKTIDYDLESMTDNIKKEVISAGYSIAAGYSIRKDGETFDEMVALADQLMYIDKGIAHGLKENN